MLVSERSPNAVLMDQARGLSVPTRGKVAFALAVVSAEGLRDDGVFLWLRDVFRGGTSLQ